MSKIKNVMYEIHELDEMADRNTQINQIHPLAKLIITIFYITCVISFDKYDMIGLLPMMLYPLLLFGISDLSILHSIKKLRVVLPFVCFIGIFNPFFDHRQIYNISSFVITGGMVSMITLILKGIYTLMASYLLIVTTGIERLCYALKLLHIPNILVTQVLLVYRYITLLLKETNHVIEAYSLRAPKQRGIKYKIWGSLIGQLLFRSINRAENLYDSMLLRGFNGEFYYARQQKSNRKDYIYLILWIIVITALKVLNLKEIIKVFL